MPLISKRLEMFCNRKVKTNINEVISSKRPRRYIVRSGDAQPSSAPSSSKSTEPRTFHGKDARDPLIESKSNRIISQVIIYSTF